MPLVRDKSNDMTPDYERVVTAHNRTLKRTGGTGDEDMEGQDPGTELFCIYRDCEDLALFGSYCKAHQLQRAEVAEARIAELEARVEALEAEVMQQHHIASACAEAEA